MAIERINAGAPPILWSAVDEAFNKINDNFTELALSIGAGETVDLTSLSSTIAPSESNTYDIGILDNRWRDLYLEQFIYLGNARIGTEGSVINLPAGSTIGDSGQLIDENYFKTISVFGQNNIVADEGTDTLTLSTGNGIDITTDSVTDTITFVNTGVLSLSGSTGVAVSSSTGNITLSNTGVTSLSGTTGQIGVSASTGSISLTNLGVIELTTDPGSGIGLSATKGTINISNLAPNIAQNVFRFVSVPGQGTIEADNIADTLTFSPGYGIILTTSPFSDTLTVTLNQNIDINGSVFSDDSALLVDGVSGKIVGNVDTSTIETNLITSQGGNFNTTGQSLIIGAANGTDIGGTTVIGGGTGTAGTGGVVSIAGGTGVGGSGGGLLVSGGTGSVGGNASFEGGVGSTGNGGLTTISGGTGGAGNGGGVTIVGGAGSIENGVINIGATNTSAVNINNANVIGDLTGSVFSDDSVLLVDAVDGKIVGPIDTTTVVASTSINSLSVITSTIDSDDSSSITIIPSVVFNSDITVENELIVDNIPGYVKLDILKSVVSDSTDFTDFQAKIAAL